VISLVERALVQLEEPAVERNALVKLRRAALALGSS
jgi:hypothetical protein